MTKVAVVINEEMFTALVNGKTAQCDEAVIILADIGFKRIVEIVTEAIDSQNEEN